MSTVIARFSPAAHLPWHLHRFSEAMTILRGVALVEIEDRSYRLEPHDCLHVPAGTAHLVRDGGAAVPLVAHCAFAAATPSRVLLADEGAPGDGTPRADATREHIVRPSKDSVYELAPGAFFSDGFARRFGAEGICGGSGRFLPGASLPCHTHDFDESITIVRGTATCMVQGRRYELSDCDTAFIPRGMPHRFLNTSENEMAMIWVYAGAEPDRQIVDNRLCFEQYAELSAEERGAGRESQGVDR